MDDLFFLEKYAYRESIIHRLDSRVKILVTFAAIIAMVAVPYTPDARLVAVILLLFCGGLWLLAGLPPLVYFTRLAMVLPFGIFIIIFQIFFKNPYYDSYHVLASLPAGITIYAESVEFSTILLAKFVVCVSFVILLSSTTRMQDLLVGAGRLGLPREFTLCIGMMIRYLFVFARMVRRTRNALQTRCFDPFDRTLSYRYRLRQLGLSIGTIFLRSYEQGERTYIAMLCRGYTCDSHLFIGKKPLAKMDIGFFACSLLIIITVPLAVILFA